MHRAIWHRCSGSALIIMAVCVIGCPYSFSGSSLPGHIKTVAVPTFANETLDATIADEVTRATSESFLADNRLRVVRETRADCVLEGTVSEYERRVYSYSADEEPEEYIVVVTLAVVLKDRVKNRDLWSNEKLQATATYAAGSDESDAKDSDEIDSEGEAREKAIELLTHDIIARTLEEW